jgi:hypothetical protein
MRVITFIILAAIFVLDPRLVYADIGVPMVAVFLPPLWLSLVPIIVIEGLIVKRMAALSYSRAFVSTGLANAVSTVVGIPLMWVILATTEGTFAGTALGLNTIGQKIYAVTVQAPWLIPYEEDLGWMIPIALVVLAVPAYFLSVLVEHQVVFRFATGDQRPNTKRAVAIANLASYMALALLFVVVGYAGISLGPVFKVFDGVTNWLIEIVFRIARLFLNLG